jgi:hypothetical protein
MSQSRKHARRARKLKTAGQPWTVWSAPRGSAVTALIWARRLPAGQARCGSRCERHFKNCQVCFYEWVPSYLLYESSWHLYTDSKFRLSVLLAVLFAQGGPFSTRQREGIRHCAGLWFRFVLLEQAALCLCVSLYWDKLSLEFEALSWVWGHPIILRPDRARHTRMLKIYLDTVPPHATRAKSNRHSVHSVYIRLQCRPFWALHTSCAFFLRKFA